MNTKLINIFIKGGHGISKFGRARGKCLICVNINPLLLGCGCRCNWSMIFNLFLPISLGVFCCHCIKHTNCFQNVIWSNLLMFT